MSSVRASALAAGERGTAFAEPAVEAVGQGVDGFGKLGGFKRGPELCIVSGGVAQQQVIADGVSEEMGGLAQIGDAVAYRFGGQKRDIGTAETDLAAGRRDEF
jgi:hypothetical protein